MTYDPALKAHRDWIGLLQPVGVVASPPALLAAQAILDENLTDLRAAFDAVLLPPKDEDGVRKTSDALPLHIKDFTRLAKDVLGWDPSTDLVPEKDLPDALRVPLPEYDTELAPTWGVPVAPDMEDPSLGEAGRWLCLIQCLPRGWDLDTAHGSPHGRDAWHASPHARFERLLRETKVPLGLLFNETSLRVVYQPAGEASGHVTFPFALLSQTQGGLALGALKMLLGADRLFSVPVKQRLPAILRESRKYQNEVSQTLAGQVLDALWDLLRGFHSAHLASGDTLLQSYLNTDRGAIYGGLLTVLLRLVFILKAEDQGLLPAHALYAEGYSVRGLFESLRDDVGRYPDTMDQRVHAWGRLIALFRMIHDGAAHGALRLPPRYGDLFDPDAYPFLEGRPRGSRRVAGEVLSYPKVSDGVIYRVLANLLVLDGESLSYRTLDVEQLGGVYEALMGFTVERVTGASVALTPHDVVVDLDALLAVKPERAKALGARIGKKVDGELARKVDAARSVDELIAALSRRISRRTPTALKSGALVLQPTEERRRSGSHYTPRALTEPIVKTTLDPVLDALAKTAPEKPGRPRTPTPEQVLGLKVCDPAMGSGAFLVAACRYLGDALVRAWGVHGAPTGPDAIPPDEDEVLHARRLVAQHCLYGVDRNPFAVSLAKLSLWLVTMAKAHPFTFLDPVLRHGDSLVGLSRDQLGAFHWDVDASKGVQFDLLLANALSRAASLRTEIAAKASSDDTAEKSRLHRDAEDALADARMLGDLVVESFFGASKDKERAARLKERHAQVVAWQAGKLPREALEHITAQLELGIGAGERPVWTFHWPLAFPEVFARENPGFDAIVGNPPFMGGTKTSTSFGECYRDWLAKLHPGGNSNADLVAHFFRRSFSLIRGHGCFGLIATNSIFQGDTRETGLTCIRLNGGCISNATRRLPWPGLAAVIVSVVHISKSPTTTTPILDGRPVESISAYLFPNTTDSTPPALDANAETVSRGNDVFGSGFLFDDSNEQSTPTHALAGLLAVPTNHELVKKYLTGEDINTSPTQSPSRMIIDFGEMSEQEARQHPELFSIVERLVKPARATVTQRDRRELWWLFATRAPRYRKHVTSHEYFFAASMVSQHLAIAKITGAPVISNTLVAFCDDRDAFFAVMQSRVHELWARFFGSSMKDDLRYTPSDCFETFPFPAGWEADAALESIGREYHAHRAALMIANDEGLTKTYNRFHDPDETSAGIVALRALHDRMDRAVLAAYGWKNLDPACEFLAEHPEAEDEEDEGKGRKKKRAMRYRWPDAARDEVLAKLLKLNAERAAAEKKARELAAQMEKVSRKLKGGKKG